jgi:hypothetical protein
MEKYAAAGAAAYLTALSVRDYLSVKVGVQKYEEK